MQKILIVEDDADIAAIERDYLELNNFQVEIAGDGITGLELGLHGTFDLILLDLMLPGMDGFAVCRRLREVSENIPENYEFLHYVNYHAALAGVRAQILRNDRDKAQTALEKLALYVGKNAVYHEEARRIEKEIA